MQSPALSRSRSNAELLPINAHEAVHFPTHLIPGIVVLGRLPGTNLVIARTDYFRIADQPTSDEPMLAL
jgi:hypothetical protein